jgi:hypothetical protein
MTPAPFVGVDGMTCVAHGAMNPPVSGPPTPADTLPGVLIFPLLSIVGLLAVMTVVPAPTMILVLVSVPEFVTVPTPHVGQDIAGVDPPELIIGLVPVTADTPPPLLPPSVATRPVTFQNTPSEVTRYHWPPRKSPTAGLETTPAFCTFNAQIVPLMVSVGVVVVFVVCGLNRNALSLVVACPLTLVQT